MTRAAALALAAVLLSAPRAPVLAGPAIDVDLRPYVEAAATGRVTVRGYQERPRPTMEDVPLSGTSILLVPRSAALLDRLQALKADARDSMAAYRGAASGIRAAQESFAQALRDAGAATIVRTGSLDAGGRLVLPDVPAGDWLLLGSRASMVDVHSTKRGRRDERTFDLPPRLMGYESVTIWLKEVRVEAGSGDVVELTDRNVWFSGVQEVPRRDGTP